MTFKPLSAAVILAGSLAACHQSSPASPSPPYTLSGEVTEATPTGPVAVAGALVETAFTGGARTDDQGRYSLAGVWFTGANITIWASKSGYSTRTVTRSISGDTRVDLQLERRPTYTLSGVIFEITATGRAPIEGVQLDVFSYISRDMYTDRVATTDAKGHYSIPEIWAGPDVFNGLWLEKKGYRIEPQLSPSCDGCFRTLTLTSDTVLDIQLDPLPNPAPDLSPSAYNPVFPSADPSRSPVTGRSFVLDAPDPRSRHGTHSTGSLR